MAESTWEAREIPILEAVAAAGGEPLESDAIVEATGLEPSAVGYGVEALVDGQYLTGKDWGDMSSTFPEWGRLRLAERGRRAVGAWPREEGGLDVLLDLLAERIAATDDPDERSRLERFRDAAKDMGSQVGTSLLTAWLKSVAGL